MQVRFLAKFNRDLNEIRLNSVKESIAIIIDEVKSTDSIQKIPNIKKLKGFRSAYRIRIGDYRIGVFVEGNHIDFARVLHRREIYRFFP
jgi:mRNA interferase RelE/StbE